MTSNRSQAYGRVVSTLDELGPTKLLADELELVRECADLLFFCEDLGADPAARDALAACRELGRRLIESERWLEDTALRLLGDIEACGPSVPAPLVALR